MKNGGLEWFWGLLGELLEAFGPQDGPKLKKGSILTLPRPPPEGPFGSLFGTFSSLGCSWDLKMVVLGGHPFCHHFCDHIALSGECTNTLHVLRCANYADEDSGSAQCLS